MKWVVPIVFVVIFGGCSVSHPGAALTGSDGTAARPDAQTEAKVRTLQDALMALSPACSTEEAGELAVSAVLYPRKLAARYELVAPPYLHNFLITVGVKQRGLCYHWAGDLMAYLKEKRFKHFDLYRAVAEQGGLREHHSVVVTAKGGSFADGIVLDAWRGSSDLYFARVAADDEYGWSENRRHGAYRAF